MVNFTLDELMKFAQKERQMVEEILPHMGIDNREPSESSVKNLLAYSKALSIRKSEKLETFRIVLN